jgi:hypothetical protein
VDNRFVGVDSSWERGRVNVISLSTNNIPEGDWETAPLFGIVTLGEPRVRGWPLYTAVFTGGTTGVATGNGYVELDSWSTTISPSDAKLIIPWLSTVTDGPWSEMIWDPTATLEAPDKMLTTTPFWNVAIGTSTVTGNGMRVVDDSGGGSSLVWVPGNGAAMVEDKFSLESLLW